MAHRTSPHGTFGKSGRRVWWWVGAVGVVLGVVTNVGVAWWCVYRSVSIWSYSAPAPMYVSAAQGLPHRRWFGYERLESLYLEGTPLWTEQTKGSTPEYVLASAAVAFREARGLPDVQGSDRCGQGEFHAAGWPWLSVCSVSFSIYTPAGPQFVDRGGWWCEGLHPDLEPVVGEWAVGIDPTTRFRRVIFPCRPLWPGFIANTVVYSTLCVLAALALMASRVLWPQARRARRGQCRRCGYDRRGLASAAVCPECGKGA